MSIKKTFSFRLSNPKGGETLENISDSSILDLSNDSNNNKEPSYLEVKNPKYNIQMQIEKEKMKSKFLKRLEIYLIIR